MSEKQFIDGISAKAPHDKAPDFIKARVSIKLSDFAQYLRDLKKAEPDVEWLNFDVKEAKSGKWYAERDTWKPDTKHRYSAPSTEDSQHDDDIPF